MGLRLRIRIASLLEQFDLRLPPFRRGRLAMRAALAEQRGARDRIARLQRESLLGAFHITTKSSPLLTIERDDLYWNIARRHALPWQEQSLQIIEKPAPQGRCSQVHVVALEQAAPLAFFQLLFHQRQRKSGSLAEQSHRYSFGQPQCIEHELEADFGARD